MKMSDSKWPAEVTPILLDDAEEAAGRLAIAVAERLDAALALRDRASLAVSGGSTPKAFFRVLSQQTLAWERVDITLVDERWVESNDPDSNEGLVRQHLLTGAAARARFIGLKHAGDFGGSGQRACEQALQAMTWPLDVLVLGMGNDGHTASFFPDAPELAEALDPANPKLSLALTPPSQAQKRVSLTLGVLHSARYTALHLKGDDKLTTLERALADLSDVPDMPVRAFLAHPLSIFWSP